MKTYNTNLDQIWAIKSTQNVLYCSSNKKTVCYSIPQIIEISSFQSNGNSVTASLKYFYFLNSQSVQRHGMEDKKLIYSNPIKNDSMEEIEVNIIDSLLAISFESGKLIIYNLKTKSESKAKYLLNSLFCLSFRNTLPKQLITGGFSQRVQVWNADKVVDKLDLECKPKFETLGINPPYVYSLCSSHDGNIIYCGLGSGDIMVLTPGRNIKALNPSHCLLSGHSLSVTCLATFNDFLISGSLDKSIKIWKDSELIKTIEIGVKINDIQIIGNILYVGCTDNFLRSINLERW